ncbi:MAG: FkbM family methyltransferase [Actinomycetota bacterium]|nr:FkbM family methyltransferase [Actinomycetota bacterium]
MAAISRLLQKPIVVMDIGCRWGFADVWSDLGNQAVTIGFDPDVEECERLREHYDDHPGVQIVPLALGSRAGSATMHITEDPGGSSLLPAAEDAVENHPGLVEGRVVKTHPVELTTIDEWCGSEGRSDADFIKLDTQGTELDILRGGENLLQTVRAVEVEVEFNELYTGVPLFGEVDRYLREQGFVLWRLDNLAHYAQRGASRGVVVRNSQHVSFGPHDVESEHFGMHLGQLYWADAYFVRTEVARPSADHGWEQLTRDACVTAALNFFDLTSFALKRAQATAPLEIMTLIDLALNAVPGG